MDEINKQVEEFGELVFELHLKVLRNEECDTEKTLKDWLKQALLTERKRERERIVNITKTNKDAFMMPATEEDFRKFAESIKLDV